MGRKSSGVPFYPYESDAGGQALVLAPINAMPPKELFIGGVRHRRIIVGFRWSYPNGQRPSSEADENARAAEEFFHEPQPDNPGGMSNAELVKAGLATTKACSRWV